MYANTDAIHDQHMHNLVLHITLVVLHLPTKDVHYLVYLWRKLCVYLYFHTCAKFLLMGWNMHRYVVNM